MPTQAQNEAAFLYANIMAEIKFRVAAINAGTSGQIPIHPAFVLETCYLQLRMICELVAFGCLVAHGEIGGTQGLQKEWSADSILKKLEQLHPDFFPVAISSTKVGPTQHQIEVVTPPPMTKSEFLELYGQIGGKLHKGSLKKLIKQQLPSHVDYTEISNKAQKLIDLLSLHRVVLLGSDRVFMCVMGYPEEQAHVVIAEAPHIQPSA